MEATYKDSVVVIKFGGSLYEDTSKSEVTDVAQNPFKSLALAIKGFNQKGIGVILIHGGGKAINQRLQSLHLESHFEEGYRVTGHEEVKEIEMLLTGHVRNKIVYQLNSHGVKAVGIGGQDGGLIKAQKKKTLFNEKVVNLGWVGEVVQIETGLLADLLSRGIVPVVSPTGYDDAGNVYNINADTVAGAIASAMVAQRLLLMTDVDGLYQNYRLKTGLIDEIACEDLIAWLRLEKLEGGMIPKVLAAVESLQSGVASALIFNGNDLTALGAIVDGKMAVGTKIVNKYA